MNRKQPNKPLPKLPVELPISSVSEWKRLANKVTTVPLPSGAVVKVKRLDMFQALSSGKLPLDMLAKVMTSGEKMTTAAGWKSVTEEELSGLLDTMRKVVALALIEPELNDEFTVEDIPEADLALIFDRVMRAGGLAALGSFR